MKSVRTPELQKYVRRLTLFGSLALFVVGVWTIALGVAVARSVMMLAAFAAVLTIGIILLMWVLTRLSRGVVTQGALVAEKQSQLEELAEQLLERAASLEHANSELNAALRSREESEAKRRQLEEQFRHSQKMEAVGRLAGGVAHDVNNLLTAIAGFTEFALTSLPRDHPARSDVEEALDACHRGGGLTRQLLTFSRQQVMVPTMLSLNDIVTGMEQLLRRMVVSSVTLRLNLDPDIEIVKGDKGHLEQVLMNLALNARDAMPDGGQLTIATSNTILEGVLEPQRDAVTQPGPHVMLSVTDTGVGMDTVTRERIFEPFFTTKPMGQGTGLGLATVYGIVKQSGGTIWVYSEPGQGSTFKVYFPAVEDAAESDRPRVSRAIPERGSGLVLVVDDDEAIRGLSVRALERAGFDVLDARNGSEGLAIARQHENLRAVVADVVMPTMGGREMMRQLGALGISIPVLYVSGWAAGALDAESFLSQRDAFLEKPFSPEMLLRALNALLAQQESPVGAQAL